MLRSRGWGRDPSRAWCSAAPLPTDTRYGRNRVQLFPFVVAAHVWAATEAFLERRQAARRALRAVRKREWELRPPALGGDPRRRGRAPRRRPSALGARGAAGTAAAGAADAAGGLQRESGRLRAGRGPLGRSPGGAAAGRRPAEPCSGFAGPPGPPEHPKRGPGAGGVG